MRPASETRAASLTYPTLRGHKTCGDFGVSVPESPELAQPISGVQRRQRLDPGYPLTQIPGAKKRERKVVPSPPRGGEGFERPISDWLRERVRRRLSKQSATPPTPPLIRPPAAFSPPQRRRDFKSAGRCASHALMQGRRFRGNCFEAARQLSHLLEADDGRAEDDDEQHRQEEHDHRHG